MIRLREYETIAILNPELPDDAIERLKGRVVNVLEKMESKILRLDNWGKRKLAFEVNKHAKGVYLFALYLGNPGVVEELERNFKMWDDVLRYQTVKVDQDVNPDSRPSEISDEELKTAEEASLRPAPDLTPPGFEQTESADTDDSELEEEVKDDSDADDDGGDDTSDDGDVSEDEEK